MVAVASAEPYGKPPRLDARHPRLAEQGSGGIGSRKTAGAVSHAPQPPWLAPSTAQEPMGKNPLACSATPRATLARPHRPLASQRSLQSPNAHSPGERRACQEVSAGRFLLAGVRSSAVTCSRFRRAANGGREPTTTRGAHGDDRAIAGPRDRFPTPSPPHRQEPLPLRRLKAE